MRAAWWWIDRWRKSTADMNLMERGAYRELLDECWLRGGVIPADEAVLIRVCACTPAEWDQIKANVLARFEKCPGGLVASQAKPFLSRHRRLPPLGRDVHRPHVPLRTQRFVRARDQGRCVWCGGQSRLEFDHVHRYRDGGSHSRENLRLLCQPCNRRRG